ncbi:MAG: InlB B-repeat-containing protein [Clostridia bacterium]|nr:InlB B-repeat-containing protein [Clostridia bacterium]
MKKLISFLVCLALVFSLYVPVCAVESQYKSPAPEITGFSELINADKTSFDISFTHSLSEAEAIRELMYDLALSEHGSEEALKSSAESYLCFKTKLYCEISLDGYNWYTLKEISGSYFNLSLNDEILPFLKEKTENFIFFIRLLLASENFRDENVSKVYIYTPSESTALYSLSDNILIPDGIPLCFSEALKEDTVLSIPQRTGFIFDGWSETDDVRISFIPADTKEITLKAHWIPKTYEINYAYNSPGGIIDNTKNPVSYTVGTAQKILTIKSPVVTHIFDGWYYSEDFSGERVTEISIGETGDKVLYAKWLSIKEIEEAKRLERENFIKEKKYGDLDSDGRISASDARMVLRYVVRLETLDYEIIKRADYLNTNKISADNARTTLRIAVGLDSLYDILLENGILP